MPEYVATCMPVLEKLKELLAETPQEHYCWFGWRVGELPLSEAPFDISVQLHRKHSELEKFLGAQTYASETLGMKPSSLVDRLLEAGLLVFGFETDHNLNGITIKLKVSRMPEFSLGNFSKLITMRE